MPLTAAGQTLANMRQVMAQTAAKGNPEVGGLDPSYNPAPSTRQEDGCGFAAGQGQLTHAVLPSLSGRFARLDKPLTPVGGDVHTADCEPGGGFDVVRGRVGEWLECQ